MTVAALLLLAPAQALAWGERGHDVVTRVAARLVAARLGAQSPLGGFLVDREHTLSHLSNVPDIVWRDGPADVVRDNGPTHYFGIDLVLPKVDRAAALGLTLAAVRVTAADVRLPMDDVGTAPWRIEQLYELMRRGLPKRDGVIAAGVLSHFVADMAVPVHATSDYDGWKTAQGGVHAYFESDVVEALPLSLEQKVLEHALRHEPAKRLAPGKGPLLVALALTADTHAQLETLRELDRAHALLEPSREKLAAKRRPAHEVAPRFEAFVVERMATAADVLARLWTEAWREAGEPARIELGKPYPLVPEFIPVSYR